MTPHQALMLLPDLRALGADLDQEFSEWCEFELHSWSVVERCAWVLRQDKPQYMWPPHDTPREAALLHKHRRRLTEIKFNVVLPGTIHKITIQGVVEV